MLLMLCMLIEVLNPDGWSAARTKPIDVKAFCARTEALWAPLCNCILDLHGHSHFLYNAVICS